MTPEQKRIAIAEACPRTIRRWQQVPNGPFSYEYKDGNGWHQCKDDDILLDLNAMHEAEKELSGHVRFNYSCKLERIVNQALGDSESAWCYSSATAAQRADAFLLTLGILNPEDKYVRSMHEAIGDLDKDI